jgi:hypothetical protein
MESMSGNTYDQGLQYFSSVPVLQYLQGVLLEFELI